MKINKFNMFNNQNEHYKRIEFLSKTNNSIIEKSICHTLKYIAIVLLLFGNVVKANIALPTNAYNVTNLNLSSGSFSTFFNTANCWIHLGNSSSMAKVSLNQNSFVGFTGCLQLKFYKLQNGTLAFIEEKLANANDPESSFFLVNSVDDVYLQVLQYSSSALAQTTSNSINLLFNFSVINTQLSSTSTKPSCSTTNLITPVPNQTCNFMSNGGLDIIDSNIPSPLAAGGVGYLLGWCNQEVGGLPVGGTTFQFFDEPIAPGTVSSSSKSGNTSDLFYGNNSTTYGVPTYFTNGYQQSYSGSNAYIGAALLEGGSGNVNRREWFTNIQPLNFSINKKYYVSVRTNLMDFSTLAIKNFGFAFYNSSGTYNTARNCQVVTNNIISDKVNWTLLSGVYQAPSTVTDLPNRFDIRYNKPLGNFGTFPDNSDIQTLLGDDENMVNRYAYYLFDDFNIQPLADAGPDVTICYGHEATIGPNCPINDPNITYSWSPSWYPLSNHNIANPTLVGTNNLTYTLTVTYNDGTNTYSDVDYVNIIVNNDGECCNSSICTVNNEANSPINQTSNVQWCLNINSMTNDPNIPIPLVTNASSISYTGYSSLSDMFNNYLFYNSININNTFNVDINLNLVNLNIFFGPNAKINVINGATLSFDNCNLKAGCDWMWDGIYVSSPSEKIIFANNSTISDAKNAVVSNNGGRFDVSGTTFLNNWQGVIVKNYASNVQGNIKSTTFTSNATLLPPYNAASKTNVAILVGDIINSSSNNLFTIGSNASVADRNYFNNLSSGIKLIRSKVKVINSDFQNISDNSYSNPYGLAGGRAIDLSGNGGIFPSRYIIGGLAANEANYFDNVQNGVYSSVLTNTNHNMNVYLYKNTMKNIQYKAISINSTNRDIRILTNIIDNFKYGIDLYNNPNAKVIIGNNAINNDFNVPLNFALAYPQAGNPNEAFINNNIDAIRITEIGTKTTYQLNIYNNRIGNFDFSNAIYRYACKRGITVTNVKNYPRIVDNIIYQMADPDVNPGNTNAAHYGWGIKCENSNNLSIKDNSITTADRWKWWNDGIRLSNCSDSRLQCNYSFRTSSGIFFDGSQANTLLTNNQMRRNIWGLVINNGSIGNQSINGMPTDNTWVGPYNGGNGGFYHTLCWGNSIPNATILGIRNTQGTVYNPPLVQNGVTTNSVFQIDAFYSNNLIGNQFNCSSTNTYAQDFSDLPPVTEMIQIINGYYGGDPNYANSEWWMKRALYERAYFKNELLEDPTVAEFVGNESVQPMGLLEDVNSLMYDTIIDTLNIAPPKDWVYVDAKNNSIAPSNDIEAKYKEVNAVIISLNLQEGLNLTTSQTQQLQDIAKLCPSEYGPGVYTARAVLRGMRDGEDLYLNNCEIILPFESTSNGRAALHKPQPDIGNEEDDYRVIGSEATNTLFTNLDFKVYPNPAQNNLSVVLGGLDNFEVNYVLIDALGKKILVTDKTTNNMLTNVDVSALKNGLYLLQAIVNGKVVTSQKISIIK